MRTAPRLIDRLLRLVLTAGRRLLRGRARPASAGAGAHAVALTPGGAIILVKLRYAPSWRLPGGGRDAGEDLEQAALRELREEIGMTAHGHVRIERGLLIVEDIAYAPRRWSWEVEAVGEFALDRLPPDLSPRARHWLEQFGHDR